MHAPYPMLCKVRTIIARGGIEGVSVLEVGVGGAREGYGAERAGRAAPKANTRRRRTGRLRACRSDDGRQRATRSVSSIVRSTLASFTSPAPGQYHLRAVAFSITSYSSISMQSLNVPAGTLTVRVVDNTFARF